MTVEMKAQLVVGIVLFVVGLAGYFFSHYMKEKAQRDARR
jgi:flagellar basal body-associated protein FliL